MNDVNSIDLIFGYSPLLWGIALAVAAILTMIAYRMTNPLLSRGKRAVLSALRFFAFLAILLMILEPIVVLLRSELIQPRLAILFDDSKSMSLSDKLGDRNATLNNIKDNNELKILANKYPSDFYRFSDSLIKIDRSGKLTTNGIATALGDALLELRSNETPDKPVGAVVVFSDGEVNYGEDPMDVAYRSRFPIYAVGIGDPTPPKDITIRKLTAQNLAYVGQKFPILASVSSYGYEGKDAVVRLSDEKGKKGETRLTLGGKGELTDIEFSVVPDSEGIYTYRVSIPAAEGELTATNNSRSVRVNILPSKRKILVIGKELNWEFTFFTRVLSSNPDLIVEKAFIGALSKSGDTKVPQTLERLKEYDVVAIVGCLKELASNKMGDLFLQYLKSGGALQIQILGDANLDRVEGAIWAQIFPFIYSQGSHIWTTDIFNPDLTVSGSIHPATRISENMVSPREAYQNLPPLSGFAMVTGSAPASTILMTHPRLLDVPIIAVREVGAGRVSVFNGAGFWRWGFMPFGFGGNNKTYISLISNTIAWLLAAGSKERFVIETDKAVYRSGEKIIVTAHLRDEANKPLEGAAISVSIYNTDVDTSKKDTLHIVLEDKGGGIYSQEIPPSGIGNWRIYADAELDEQTIASTSAKFLVEEYSIELENVHLDENLLKNIASSSGGKYVRASDFGSIIDSIKIPEYPIKKKIEKAFWDNPFLLLIFVALLCSEWILRKRWDLP